VRLETGNSYDDALVRVSNSGPQADVAAARRLSEPFQRFDRHGDGRGAGLGLSIVRSMSEAHGGRLAITPRDEGGLVVGWRCRLGGWAAGPAAMGLGRSEWARRAARRPRAGVLICI
jgi:K+-sensing histidine kinase KdpD